MQQRKTKKLNFNKIHMTHVQIMNILKIHMQRPQNQEQRYPQNPYVIPQNQEQQYQQNPYAAPQNQEQQYQQNPYAKTTKPIHNSTTTTAIPTTNVSTKLRRTCLTT